MNLSVKDNGFSLMEVVVVMAILAILAAIAYPAFRTWSANAAYRERARDLVSSMRLKRQKSITNCTPENLPIPIGTHDNIVLKWTDACDQSTALNITFFPDGSLTWSPPGGDPDLVVCVLDTSGQERFKITVKAPTGRATITKP